MSVTDLPTLKVAVLEWSARSGAVEIEDNLDDIIQFAEARIERELVLDSMLRSVTYTPPLDPESTDGKRLSIESITLPDDFNAVSNIKTKGGVAWEWRPQDEMARAGTTPAEPTYYTIAGCELSFNPPKSVEITLRYYKKFPRLASLPTGKQTHALLTTYPDLYVFGGLTQLIIFDRSYEEAPTWEREYQRIMSEIGRQNQRSRYPIDQPLRSSVGLRGRRTV